MLYTGVVENRQDPLKLGRCQVRVVGVHTHDKTILPTEDLPWAYPLQPITSAAISGIGSTPLGLVEGTWVVVMFRDPEDMQQPVMLGSVGGIPQKEFAEIDSDEDVFIAIDSIAASQEVDANGNVVPSGSTSWANKPGNVLADSNGNVSGSTTDLSTAQNVGEKSAGKIPPREAQPGINALNAAMDAAGITGRYARAAIQGIVGGESGWIPQKEGFSYSVDALKVVFSKTFQNRDELANRYARWKGTRESFFDLVYSPENNGSLVGNSQEGDGGRFYGRGLIQLTGRANYVRYGRLTGLDLLTRPDDLSDDMTISARVAVEYFRDRVAVDQNDPSYFMAALRAVGGDKRGWPKKENYYKYFLGESVPPDQTDKSTVPGKEVENVLIGIRGVPKDREKSLIVGFSDPNMKYPLRQYIGEPDTHRLARGRIDGTIVEFKDEKRVENIKCANDYTWTQPDIPYNAKYPYNKVTETESGHVMEFDDTPDNERVHIYHRKGTYTEIDANGTQVNRIVGDGYEIIDRNGYVYVNGECNLTVGGVTRIMCLNDAFIEVQGNTRGDFRGDLEMNVAKEMRVNVAGEFKLRANAIKLESNTNLDARMGGYNRQTSGGRIDFKSNEVAYIDGPTVHWAQDLSSDASPSGIGNPIDVGTKTTETFTQLKPQPRNLEEEIKFETPEEVATTEGQQYHQQRQTGSTSDQAEVIEEAPKPENIEAPKPTSCDFIYSSASVPNSYVVHTDGLGYKWTMGSLLRSKPLKKTSWNGKTLSEKDIMCNLKGLAENILGPINENIGSVGKLWTISSIYRNDVPPGGVAKSQHLIGCAVDFVCGTGSFSYKLNYDWAVKLAAILPYDQLLLEYRDPGVNGNKNKARINWIHVSYNPYGTGRKQSLTLLNDRTFRAGFTNLAPVA
jgi:predicted chitinase